MNVGIVILPNGSPCLVYDEKLGTCVRRVEFSYADHQMTLVYEVAPPDETDDPFGAKRKGIQKLSKIARKRAPTMERMKLDYPLDRKFLNLLEKTKFIGVTPVLDMKLADVRVVPVVFTNT